MLQDDQGVWSLTTAPLAPDYYSYSFVADGVRLIDPSNSADHPESALHRKRRSCSRAAIASLGSE